MSQLIIDTAAAKTSAASLLDRIALDYKDFKKEHGGKERIPDGIRQMASRAVASGSVSLRDIATCTGLDPSSIRGWLKEVTPARKKIIKRKKPAQPAEAPKRSPLKRLADDIRGFRKAHRGSHAHFPKAIKDQVRNIVKAGISVQQIVDEFDLSYGTVYSWVKPQPGSLKPAGKKRKGRPYAPDEPDPSREKETLLDQLAQDYKTFKQSHPESDAPITMEMREKARAALCAGVSVSQVAIALGTTPGTVSGWVDLIAGPRKKPKESVQYPAKSHQRAAPAPIRQPLNGQSPVSDCDWITVRVEGREIQVRRADFWSLVTMQ